MFRRGRFGFGRVAESILPPLAVAGLQGWWDAAQAGAYVNNDAVSQWNDRSGQANHATQGTAAAQPTFLTGQQNGLPGISFDGGDRLGVAGLADLADGEDIPFSVMAVARQGTVATGENLISWGDIALDHYMLFHVSGANRMYFAVRSGGAEVNASGINAVGNTAARLFTWVKPGTTINAWMDSTQEMNAANADAGAVNCAECNIGAIANAAGWINLWQGLIYEILIYNRAITAAERLPLEAYLNAKWAVY